MDLVKIYIADDHTILREGLKLILGESDEYEVIGESGDGKEALDSIERLKPDIALLDIAMPTMSGIEVAKKLRKYAPDTKIIILSRHDNEEYVKHLLHYGISGYIIKDDAGEDLLRAIDEVMKGNIYLSSRITKNLVYDYLSNSYKTENDKDSIFNTLSQREREVIKLIAEGISNNDIAKVLRISPKTVKVHRANIMKKLDVHKVADLVTYAIKNQLVEI